MYQEGFPPPLRVSYQYFLGEKIAGKKNSLVCMNKPCKSPSCPWGEQQLCSFHLNNAAKWEDTIFLKLCLHEECELCNLHLMLLAILLAYWKLITNENFWCRSLGAHSSAWRQSHDPSSEQQLRRNSLEVLAAEEHPKHREFSIKPKYDPLPTSQAWQEVLYLFLYLIQLDTSTWMFWLQSRHPVPPVEQFGTKTKPV